jgi:hypothetical protein
VEFFTQSAVEKYKFTFIGTEYLVWDEKKDWLYDIFAVPGSPWKKHDTEPRK